jgi:hypothetical protein
MHNSVDNMGQFCRVCFEKLSAGRGVIENIPYLNNRALGRGRVCYVFLLVYSNLNFYA